MWNLLNVTTTIIWLEFNIRISIGDWNYEKIQQLVWDNYFDYFEITWRKTFKLLKKLKEDLHSFNLSGLSLGYL